MKLEARSDAGIPRTVLRRFDSLRVWSRRDRRAPHKPLLVLWALGQWQSKGRVRFSFEEVETAIRPLLQEFGTGGARQEPKFPFLHLTSDGVWSIQVASGQFDPSLVASRSARRLREAKATGGFSESVLAALNADPDLCERIAGLLLSSHFPGSIRSDIAEAVGLSPSEFSDERAPAAALRRRDPEFRPNVLRAYGRQCAVCGLDLYLGGVNIGLEASHIRWFEADGPDDVSNGLALCPLHHKVFDLGCFTLRQDLRIDVSEEVSGGPIVSDVLGRFHGQPILPPSREDERPRAEHVAWHRREVFRGRPR